MMQRRIYAHTICYAYGVPQTQHRIPLHASNVIQCVILVEYMLNHCGIITTCRIHSHSHKLMISAHRPVSDCHQDGKSILNHTNAIKKSPTKAMSWRWGNLFPHEVKCSLVIRLTPSSEMKSFQIFSLVNKSFPRNSISCVEMGGRKSQNEWQRKRENGMKKCK